MGITVSLISPGTFGNYAQTLNQQLTPNSKDITNAMYKKSKNIPQRNRIPIFTNHSKSYSVALSSNSNNIHNDTTKSTITRTVSTISSTNDFSNRNQVHVKFHEW